MRFLGRLFVKRVAACPAPYNNLWMGKQFIAVIEDNNTFRTLLVNALTGRQLTVYGFGNLDDFFAAMGDCMPDVIVSDIYMGSSNGLELAGKLRASGWDAPVILMSGGAEPGLQRRALESGACALLQKPFSVEQLLEAIDRA